MKEISKDWDGKTLFKKFSPSIAKRRGHDTIDKKANLFKKLGEFKNYSKTSITGLSIRPNSRAVTMECDFENGSGTVHLVIAKENGDWLIESLNINSKVFLTGLTEALKNSPQIPHAKNK